MNNLNKETLKKIKDLEVKYPTELDLLICHVKDEELQEIYRAVIKNQIEYCEKQKEAKGNYYPGEFQTSTFAEIAVKMLDNMSPLHDLIGIQPMTAPVGIVYMLRVVKLENDRMSINILSEAIEARSLKTSAGVELEPLQDRIAIDGDDEKDAAISKIGKDIADEITAIMCNHIDIMAKGDEEVPNYELKSPDQMIILIMKHANKIAEKSHRGAGNFVIVNESVLKDIEESELADFIPVPDERNDAFLQQVGTLNLCTVVYLIKDPRDIKDQPKEVTVGYRGGSGDTDTGLIYCPYIPVMSAGPVINPVTFAPVLSFMTRYGVFGDEAGKDYYSKFEYTVDP